MWLPIIVKPPCSSIISTLLHKRLFSASQALCLQQKWRKERGLPLNPNTWGALTDGADYSFLDGRPTPYGVKQKIRIERQRELAEQILTLTAEVDFAVERHKKLQLEENETKQRILDSKLKPKGIELYKKKT